MSKSILLICGSGASSGFMAANMRKAAKKEGLDYKIKARSESELGDYMDDIDALMVGPHLKAEFDAIKARVPENVTVVLMHSDYYSILDGKGAIAHLKEELGD
ncbi:MULTISPECIES: PTS lactose transporter subunit IIB [Companilactobacillus]|uniref:Cellobiose-specific PTS system IIB component n=5 Tax=Companilactobacillus TaxID=2767879 RepID=A0ABR5NVK8_9LACO|nr:MULTISPECIES: PTS lactose transporter subunit IIB [Companilactobacillus]GEO46973.1 PTS sugar transporter subunit IIB [Companilactobacillus paralimentarius]HIY93466.1 PTS sugar transporter subunit IIB [Candidatus Companilactobacillus pullicola]KAE9558082.1 PTS sugar transporter subunit IIB [Companilactobacillus kimchii]KAE9564343.1 PTS sugar transporter subunit IIB [Companilactobacillus bobalius]KRK52884.1 cellobiose-specific PTS system IIB component [Companilactobacillus kimchii DSM 13961 =